MLMGLFNQFYQQRENNLCAVQTHKLSKLLHTHCRHRQQLPLCDAVRFQVITS